MGKPIHKHRSGKKTTGAGVNPSDVVKKLSDIDNEFTDTMFRANENVVSGEKLTEYAEEIAAFLDSLFPKPGESDILITTYISLLLTMLRNGQLSREDESELDQVVPKLLVQVYLHHIWKLVCEISPPLTYSEFITRIKTSDIGSIELDVTKVAIAPRGRSIVYQTNFQASWVEFALSMAIRPRRLPPAEYAALKTTIEESLQEFHSTLWGDKRWLPLRPCNGCFRHPRHRWFTLFVADYRRVEAIYLVTLLDTFINSSDFHHVDEEIQASLREKLEIVHRRFPDADRTLDVLTDLILPDDNPRMKYPSKLCPDCLSARNDLRY